VRASQIPLFGDPSRLSYLFKKQDVFAPEMLERHLAGYEPAQTEVDRFRDDPLRAHFDVSHVAALADAYGYKLSVTCRRVDTPGPEGEPIIPVQALIGPTNTAFQKGAALAHTLLAKPTAPSPVAPVPHPLLGDRVKAPIKFQQPSDCPIPQIGMTIDAPVELAPRAWYEVYIAAAHKDLPTAALPGVTFRTSRWKDVPEMMTALAFPTTGPGKPTGDLAIVGGLPPIASGIGDGSFEAALDALGFEGWPLTSAPRTSLLWLPQEGAEWLLAGVLIESPEPIERAGRCLVSGIGAQLAPTHTPVSFTTRVQDRTASQQRAARYSGRPPLA
jgi:hypothetical protein